MHVLFAHVHAQADTTFLPTFTDVEDITQTLQHMHLSDILEYADDGADMEGPNDIDVSRMLTGTPNDDFQLGGSPELQRQLRELIHEFGDIFSYNVKGKAMDVPPMTFTVDTTKWETTANRLPSRLISVAKHHALNKMLDDLLDLGVIQPSRATAWSQVHLVPKPNQVDVWRFTIDYRGLNKVISNEGWQIPNMKQMLQRIGSLRPRRFGTADLTSGFFQMPLHEDCRVYTAFITSRGIYEWTRVPMGLLPSANFFQKSMSEYVFYGLLYTLCEVYIDDLLMYGNDDTTFLDNVRAIFERCRLKNVTLNAKKLKLGDYTAEFVGHTIDASGLNMTQKRIESTIAFAQPKSLKELQSFLGLVNYFKDHLRDHSTIAYPLHQMVTAATKHSHKTLTWTTDGHESFQRLKQLVNTCAKLYFIDYKLKIVLYTDASDYAHGAYLCQLRPWADGSITEEPIRFLGGTFHGPQLRWSTIEKEAYAIHWALLRLDDLIGGVPFTIRTDHRNLLFMNNHGSRKVFQWKLDIQHYDATIEHVPGKANIPADVFSRLVVRPGGEVPTPSPNTQVNHIVTLDCTAAQRSLIEKFHAYLYAHHGVERTIALMVQHAPTETSATAWPNLKHDVRRYIQSCPTCQKMDPLCRVIRASRFTLSSNKPMARIAIDTIGPVEEDLGFRYIIVIIDTFSRYVELFPRQDVSAMAAASALWEHTCRFTEPLEIVTDFGSQFVNQMLQHFFQESGIRHHTTIPYSKEENGIVERANKEVNRHIRNILFDKGRFPNWSRMLRMTEKLLNSSIKKPLGTSPNAILFANAFNTDPGLLSTIDRDTDGIPARSVQDYIDTLMARQRRIIDAAVQSQAELNEEHLRKRYASYAKTPKLREQILTDEETHDNTTPPTSISYILVDERPSRPPIPAARTWIRISQRPDGSGLYDRVDQSEDRVIDTVAEIDTSPYVLTTYQVNDYVLRRYPPSKVGGGSPHKYGSWWRGPYQVTNIVQRPVSDVHTKPRYTIRNLVTDKEYMVDVMHIRPFYFDPMFVTPLNIAVKDTDEHVVERIVAHDFTDLNDKRWLVRWVGNNPPDETWERYDTLRDVEAFHHYCASHQLDPFLPKAAAKYSASVPNMSRRATGVYTLPSQPVEPTSSGSSRKRGRPRKL
jgi:transposase InsO family protein